MGLAEDWTIYERDDGDWKGLDVILRDCMGLESIGSDFKGSEGIGWV